LFLRNQLVRTVGLSVSSKEASYVPNLDPDERQVLVETCRHKDVFGNLFLTNKRLIFEHQSGIFTKRVYVTLDLPLEGVSNVTTEGTIGKKLVVYAKSGFVSDFPVRLDFSVRDPKQWQSSIASTRARAKETIKEKEIIKEKEVIVKVRCPYCHNLYDETSDKCPYCGGNR
jgi:hypothetical protein